MSQEVSPISAEPLWAHSDDNRLYYVDWTNVCDTGVVTTISTFDTATDQASVLTTGSLAVNTSEVKLADGTIMRPSKSVKFTISGGVSGTDYTVELAVTMSDGSSVTRVVLLKVSDT